jgi:hypothetical protein
MHRCYSSFFPWGLIREQSKRAREVAMDRMNCAAAREINAIMLAHTYTNALYLLRDQQVAGAELAGAAPRSRDSAPRPQPRARDAFSVMQIVTQRSLRTRKQALADKLCVGTSV